MTLTSSNTNWTHYVTNKARKPEYGTFDHLDEVPPKYVGNTDELRSRFNQTLSKPFS